MAGTFVLLIDAGLVPVSSPIEFLDDVVDGVLAVRRHGDPVQTVLDVGSARNDPRRLAHRQVTASRQRVHRLRAPATTESISSNRLTDAAHRNEIDRLVTTDSPHFACTDRVRIRWNQSAPIRVTCNEHRRVLKVKPSPTRRGEQPEKKPRKTQ